MQAANTSRSCSRRTRSTRAAQLWIRKPVRRHPQSPQDLGTAGTRARIGIGGHGQGRLQHFQACPPLQLRDRLRCDLGVGIKGRGAPFCDGSGNAVADRPGRHAACFHGCAHGSRMADRRRVAPFKPNRPTAVRQPACPIDWSISQRPPGGARKIASQHATKGSWFASRRPSQSGVRTGNIARPAITDWFVPV